ncbi:hypothetical protein B9479_006262 [Cryptococcus floricola]|uniref:Uncharacterized protein n=1 Tax=Cryptococcus floricola TaxID=2591691 RepID=A0A5D3ASE0_9TREE|nr:hypothetical protein B9479_006262 [Cryptococcus floricola]
MSPSHQAAAGSSAAPQPSAQPTAPTTAPPPRAEGTQASKAKRKDKARDMSPASALRRGMTPPPLLSYWKKSPKDWAKDAEGVTAMSSTELLIEWCEDRSNRDKILGKTSGYTPKKAAPEVQRYMFERNGPTMRTRVSIEKKFKETKSTFKRLYTAINETGTGNVKTVKWGGREVVLNSREEIDGNALPLAFCNKIVPFYNKWESILADAVGIADPSLFDGSDEPSGARYLNRSRAMGESYSVAGLDKDELIASLIEDDDEPEDGDVATPDPSLFAASDEPSGARDLTRARAMGFRVLFPAGLDKDEENESASMTEDDDEPEDGSPAEDGLRLGMPVEDEADGSASALLRSVSPPPPLPNHQRPSPSASPSAGDEHRSKRSKGGNPRALDRRSQVAKQKAAHQTNMLTDEELSFLEDTKRIDGERERREAERDSREMERDKREVNRDEAMRKFNTELIQIHRSAAADKKEEHAQWKEIELKKMAVEVYKQDGGSLEEAMRRVQELN